MTGVLPETEAAHKSALSYAERPPKTFSNIYRAANAAFKITTVFIITVSADFYAGINGSTENRHKNTKPIKDLTDFPKAGINISLFSV